MSYIVRIKEVANIIAQWVIIIYNYEIKVITMTHGTSALEVIFNKNDGNYRNTYIIQNRLESKGTVRGYMGFNSNLHGRHFYCILSIQCLQQSLAIIWFKYLLIIRLCIYNTHIGNRLSQQIRYEYFVHVLSGLI